MAATTLLADVYAHTFLQDEIQEVEERLYNTNFEETDISDELNELNQEIMSESLQTRASFYYIPK